MNHSNQYQLEEILDQIREDPAEKVKLAVADIDGILRGKVMHRDKFLSAAKSGFGFCDVVFGWDSADDLYEKPTVTGWHTGYPDAQAYIDLQTFRRIPWDDQIPFFLGDFSGAGADGFPACPRTLLKRIIEQAGEAGFKPIFSQEFEWFNFKETPHSLQEKGFQNLTPLTPGMFGYSILRSSQKTGFYSDLFDLLLAFDVPLEGIHTETGPGVYEAAIRYSNILEAADRAVLFKTAVKEIASRHGITATFMAKISKELPGCSGHVHQSLWDAEGLNNCFHDDDDPQKMSATMRYYLAGQLACLPHMLPFLAPTINSYKRLVEGAWAPTTLTWGLDNRTTAVRVLAGSAQASRLETRVVGSDVNPYLAMAACLASGLYGIRHELELEQPQTVGNGYEDRSHGLLPANLWEATQQMKQSEVAEELFGADFVKHFAITREWEWQKYSEAVTDWEMKRYFEII